MDLLYLNLNYEGVEEFIDQSKKIHDIINTDDYDKENLKDKIYIYFINLYLLLISHKDSLYKYTENTTLRTGWRGEPTVKKNGETNPRLLSNYISELLYKRQFTDDELISVELNSYNLYNTNNLNLNFICKFILRFKLLFLDDKQKVKTDFPFLLNPPRRGVIQEVNKEYAVDIFLSLGNEQYHRNKHFISDNDLEECINLFKSYNPFAPDYNSNSIDYKFLYPPLKKNVLVKVHTSVSDSTNEYKAVVNEDNRSMVRITRLTTNNFYLHQHQISTDIHNIRVIPQFYTEKPAYAIFFGTGPAGERGPHNVKVLGRYLDRQKPNMWSFEYNDNTVVDKRKFYTSGENLMIKKSIYGVFNGGGLKKTYKKHKKKKSNKKRKSIKKKK